MQLFDLQYFPCFMYVKALINEEFVIFESRENFQKMSFRNRCIVWGSNGVIPLSIPLKNGREQHCLITNVEMEHGRAWRNRHWKTITSCYSRSPYFEYYGPGIHDLIFSSESLLFQFNLQIIKWILKMLPVHIDISFTAQYEKNGDQYWKDRRNEWTPKNYNIMHSESAAIYTQVFHNETGHNRNLSIIDLLFCEGPNALALLKQ